jgi:hypothetical protein
VPDHPNRALDRTYLRIMVALLLAALATPAYALATGTIALHDLPGTAGEWQEGVAIVPAPPAEVQGWLTDYERWVGRFPDIDAAKHLGVDARGRHVVRFHSRLAGRVFVVHEAVQPGLLVFDGWAPNVYTQGRIWILDAGGGSSRVIMQSTAQVHGFIGLFATRGYKRKSAFAAITSHLNALISLARAARTRS